MSEQEETNIEKKTEESQLFRPHLLRVKKVILGEENPRLYPQIVFFVGLFLSSVFGIWSVISFFILKSPAYLKQHKQVDVNAIIELRGRELGFEEDQFFRYLENFHLAGIILWFIILIGFILLWRQIKWSVYVIISAMIIYLGIMVFMLGPTYFVEDTTLFDKLSLLVLFILLVIQHFVSSKKPIEYTPEDDYE